MAARKTATALDAWIGDVLADRVVVGKLVRLAVERHVADMDSGRSRGLIWDQSAADRAIAFCGHLRQSKGEWAGQPLVLQGWQQFIFGSLYGWKRQDGTRRFRESYSEIARKNGKSTVAGALGNYAFVADHEAGAEVYSAATKRDQARIVWEEARAMVRRSPELKQLVRVMRDRMEIDETRAKFEPLSAEEDSLDGLNPSTAILDEVHAWKGRGVYDVINTATGARRQPLIFSITTAGWDRNSVCWSLHSHARNVLTGAVQDDSFFAFVAAIDDGDDWSDESCWVKANPNLGVSVKVDDLRRKCAKAKAQPAEQNAFRRLHCNQWTEQVDRWLDIAVWDGAEAREPIDESDYHGLGCYAGLDLASTTDITALALLFPEDDGSYTVIPRFWIPEDGMRERELRDRVPYAEWVDRGLVSVTDGNVTDYDEVRREINELADTYRIQELAIDRLFNATQLSTQLLEDGIAVIGNSQSWKDMAAPTRELERLVMSGRLRHGGNPVLRWMASNAAAKQDANGNIRLSKAHSTGRIDGIVATVMALGRAMQRGGGASVYETRGVIVL